MDYTKLYTKHIDNLQNFHSFVKDNLLIFSYEDNNSHIQRESAKYTLGLLYKSEGSISVGSQKDKLHEDYFCFYLEYSETSEEIRRIFGTDHREKYDSFSTCLAYSSNFEYFAMSCALAIGPDNTKYMFKTLSEYVKSGEINIQNKYLLNCISNYEEYVDNYKNLWISLLNKKAVSDNSFYFPYQLSDFNSVGRTNLGGFDGVDALNISNIMTSVFGYTNNKKDDIRYRIEDIMRNLNGVNDTFLSNTATSGYFPITNIGSYTGNNGLIFNQLSCAVSSLGNSILNISKEANANNAKLNDKMKKLHDTLFELTMIVSGALNNYCGYNGKYSGYNSENSYYWKWYTENFNSVNSEIYHIGIIFSTALYDLSEIMKLKNDNEFYTTELANNILKNHLSFIDNSLYDIKEIIKEI